MMKISGSLPSLLLPLFLATLFVTAGQSGAAQTIELVTPIEGVAGVDYHIVNYVDHDTSEGIKDFRCGTKTYDGHEGTDFSLESFRRMDSGVAILAAADGRVTQVIDSLYDRNKVSIIERGFGNWIEIEHADGWYTYYAHLRTGSAVVEVGDLVQAGEKIAEVGSAGNSTDPHLHFEVWRVTPVLHDPFGPGDCGAAHTLFTDQKGYATDYDLRDVGLLDFIPTLDTLRERPAEPTVFDEPAEVVAFWAMQVGLEAGSVMKVVWERRSDNVVWFSYEADALVRDFWYHYFWTWIDMPSDDEYRVRYLIDDREVYRRDFDVGGVSSVGEAMSDRGQRLRGYSIADIGENTSIVIISLTEEGEATGTSADGFSFTLFDIEGRNVGDVTTVSTHPGRILVDLYGMDLPYGGYILRIDGPHGAAAFPVICGR